MSITRRLFLRNSAAAGAVAATVAAPVAVEAMEPEHPWVKARRLARELSEVLADLDGGNVYAEIFPPSRQLPICFGDIDALDDRMASYERATDVVDRYPEITGIR